MSLDGYVAGPSQDLDNPLGAGGPRLHEWVFASRTARQMFGQDGGEEGIDDRLNGAGRRQHQRDDHGSQHVRPGARSLGDSEWRGWWMKSRLTTTRCSCSPTTPPADPDAGRDGVPLRGRRNRGGAGTAFDAAGGQDVRIGGGAATVQQYLPAGLIDELHLSPGLGGGDRLIDRLDGGPVGYECVELVSSPSVAHVRFARAPR
jgi:hypothetical protein